MKKEHKKVCLLFGLQLLVLFYLILTNNIVWYVCDDVIQLDIVSGAYGDRYPYAINTHILLGYLWNMLFSFLPGINWVTISYLLVYAGAFLLLDFVFVNKKVNFKILSVFLTFSFYLFVAAFTFTVVAYCAAIVGIIAVIFGIENKNKKYLWSGILFLIIGILFRGEVVKSLLFFLLLEVFFHRKEKLWAFVFLWISCCGVMYLGIYSNFWLETGTPIMSEYLEWGEARRTALDYPLLKYDERYKGISEEQYFAMQNALYSDKELIPLENLQAVCDMRGIRDRYAFDMIQFVKECFKWMHNINYGNMFYVLFYLMLFLCLINAFLQNDKSELQYLAIWLMTGCVHFVFYFIQRMPYHVLMPNYLCGMLLLIYHLKISVQIEHFLEKKIMYAVSLIPLVIILVFRPYREADNVKQQVIDYLQENNETVYVACDINVFGIVNSRDVWDYTAKYAYANVMGNWEIYSEPYYDLMEIYEIENPDSLLLEAVYNDHVKLITTLGDDFIEQREIILSWLKTNYNINASFKKVEDIVSYGEDMPQSWAVYEIETN